MHNRRDYMREYKRAYRMKKKGLPAGDYYAAFACLSQEEADKRNGGAITSWGLAGDLCKPLAGDSLDELMSLLSDVDGRLFVPGLKIWGRFIVAWLNNNGFIAYADLPENCKGYSIKVDSYGSWVRIDLRLNRKILAITDFIAVFNSPLEKVFKTFLNSNFESTGANDEAVTALKMRAAHSVFEKELSEIVGDKLSSTTISGYALQALHAIYAPGCRGYGAKFWRQDFPELPRELMDEIRGAHVYRSGLNIISPSAKEYTGAGFVYDVRSLYPYIYTSQALPCGWMWVYNYEDFRARNALRWREVEANFYKIYEISELWAKLKPDGVPTVQIINLSGTQYLKEINFNGECSFMLDDNDLEALFENYDVDFLGVNRVFVTRKRICPQLKEYGEKFYKIKESQKDTARGVCAKYLCNAITGRYGLNSYKVDTTIENGIYKRSTPQFCGEKGYLPVAMFINSFGRLYISREIRKAGAHYLYGDTDSVITDKKIEAFEVGDNMGQFKMQEFSECKFLGQKCYGLKMADGWQWVVSGASPEMLKDLKASDFEAGRTLRGGIMPKMYPDGTLAFKEREFTIATKEMIF